MGLKPDMFLKEDGTVDESKTDSWVKARNSGI